MEHPGLDPKAKSIGDQKSGVNTSVNTRSFDIRDEDQPRGLSG